MKSFRRNFVTATVAAVLCILLCSSIIVMASSSPTLLKEQQAFWSQHVHDTQMIFEINSNPHVSWKATRYPMFENMSLYEFKHRMLGAEVDESVLLKSNDDSQKLHVESGMSEMDKRAILRLPQEFDSRKQWPSCVHPIRDQQQCGSCWAFSASEVLSDRYCIATNGSVNVVLSPEFLVECSAQNNGCNGGKLDATWLFLVKIGIPTDQCVPYTSGNGVVGACPKTGCTSNPNEKLVLYKASHARRIVGAENIMIDIAAKGPVQAAMAVYRDFMSYKSGVYHHVSGGLVGGHAIKIVGWGVDSESRKPYWICANSWGPSWGIDGFFWILRGVEECGIGRDVWTGYV